MPARPLIAVMDLVTSAGGVQHVMGALLPRLLDRFEIAVLDPYRNEDYARLLAGTGVEAVALGPPPARRFVGGAGPFSRTVNLARAAPFLLTTGARLGRWVRARRPAAIWFNQLPALSLYGRLLPAGQPLLFHAHGFGRAADVRSGAWLGRRCRRIVAVSRAVANTLREAGVDPERIAVVHNAVDPEGLARRATELLEPLPPRAPAEVVLVQAGVLAPHKRQDLALAALARLPPRTVLWLCGEVPEGGDSAYEARLRRAAAHPLLRGRVRFLGHRRDLPAVLAAADVVLLPSGEESFGMVLAEAMALGKPCVGAAVGGIPEVVEHGVTGLVTAPGSAGLAAALGPLVASAELRRRMGEAGRHRVTQRFTVAAQARAMAALLAAVTAAPARGLRRPARPVTRGDAA